MLNELYCQRCDENYDVTYVSQDMDEDHPNDDRDGKKPSERFLAGEGCPSCQWGKEAPEELNLRGMAMGAMSDILGDDLDGVAAMMDDFEYMGYFD